MIRTRPASLQDLMIVESRVYRDPRGFFCESFNAREFAGAGLPFEFVQDNVSRSAKGTLRGLHFQRAPHAQGKLVRVLEGSVFDVAVDIRKGSPTFGKWHGEELSEQNGRALYIPEGFAHGFLVTSETALFNYKCTAYYAPDAEVSLRWDDPALAIAWPRLDIPFSLSAKDRNAPRLSEVDLSGI